MSMQDTQQGHPQPGPIAHQLAKMQSNQVQQSVSNGQHPSGGKSQKRAAHWTGFAGKTLWDWFNLLGAAVLIPVVIAAASIGFSVQQSQLAQKQHDSDQSIALDQQHQTVLQTYEDSIKDLLLTKGLQASKRGDPVRSIARAETLAALRQLDGDRKGLLIQFLYEADLIIIHSNGDVIIPLSHANLSYADLSWATLSYADLSWAHLRGADLRWAGLRDANLSWATLGEDTLTGADLSMADLRGAHLSKGPISPEQLQQASSLQGATMPDGSTHP
jgi:hypothetical protein